MGTGGATLTPEAVPCLEDVRVVLVVVYLEQGTG